MNFERECKPSIEGRAAKGEVILLRGIWDRIAIKGGKRSTTQRKDEAPLSGALIFPLERKLKTCKERFTSTMEWASLT